ncbi:MAG: hypothetical protein GWO16_08385 [Gammaproteobacteria bacterium]|nr:hypothetical protein [Gammaproteobacteria bacterium]NIR97966.1 hypothetical protein [Gammaproteobacteria bacterium]NIT63666.1 hypothetical protein [Gammaproteobacteria bacterium]NIV21524.1 hypothetical protein [Gammaproteobacteria bacterium]NIY32246.1 hypothetical protein [Gammaproteobacteria bacterium]
MTTRHPIAINHGRPLETVGLQDWAGFYFSGETLYTPADEPVTPGDVLALPLYRQLAADYRRAIREPLQLDFLTDL